MASKNDPTDEHIQSFANYLEQWQTVLNLNDWRIERSAKKASRGVIAQVAHSLPDRLAAWQLGADWGPLPVTDYELESAAVHELLHVMLAELIAVAQSKPDDDTMQAAEHRVINTLERILVPKRTTDGVTGSE